jgi:hypothetical protein
MPAFVPVVANRAQVDFSPVVNGQLIISVDTGEIFFDYNNRRIPISSGSGGVVSEGTTAAAVASATDYSVINASLGRSTSLSGGGSGQGLANAPEVTIPEYDGESITNYSIL